MYLNCFFYTWPQRFVYLINYIFLLCILTYTLIENNSYLPNSPPPHQPPSLAPSASSPLLRPLLNYSQGRPLLNYYSRSKSIWNVKPFYKFMYFISSIVYVARIHPPHPSIQLSINTLNIID